MLLRIQWFIILTMTVWAQVSCQDDDEQPSNKEVMKAITKLQGDIEKNLQDLLEQKMSQHIEKIIMFVHGSFSIMEGNLEEIKQDIYENMKILEAKTDQLMRQQQLYAPTIPSEQSTSSVTPSSQSTFPVAISGNAMWEAVQRGDLMNVHKALASGTDVNWQNIDPSKQTTSSIPTSEAYMPSSQSTFPTAISGNALWEAVQRGDLMNVHKALASGTVVNWQWQNKDPSKRSTSSNIINEAYIPSRQSIFPTPISGNAMWEAAKRGDLISLNKALASGTDVNWQNIDWFNQIPLHAAAWANHPSVAKALLAAGADKDRQDNWGQTPISEASAVGNINVVNTLLSYGADVDIPNNDGDTPLMRASKQGFLPIVEALLNANASVHRTDWWGNTALHWAASINKVATIKVLLQAGADPRKQNNDGHTPADYARELGLDDLADIMEALTGPKVIHG